jgi:hypothetical protein
MLRVTRVTGRRTHAKTFGFQLRDSQREVPILVFMRTFLVLLSFAVLVDALAFDGRVRYSAIAEVQSRTSYAAFKVHDWINRTFVL